MLPDDPRIAIAIHSYPIAPLPRGFIRRTMHKINPVTVRFQLHFLDLALPAFLSVFLGALTATALLATSATNPIWFLRLERELAWLQMTRPALIPAVVIGLLLCFGLVLATISAFFWFERSTTRLLANHV